MADELLSPTYRSSQLHTPRHLERITIDDPHYRTYRKPELNRWGRHWSYGGIGPPSFWTAPAFRPLSGAPVAKGHDHVGSGLFPYPRGLPVKQLYDVTSLRRSNLRWNDQLSPRPLTSGAVKDMEVDLVFPAEHPLSSHVSRFSLFPSTESSPRHVPFAHNLMSPTESTACFVASKTRGSPFRREVISSRGTSHCHQPLIHDIWDVPRGSRRLHRSKTYPGPLIAFSTDPATREGTHLDVRPKTARALHDAEQALTTTHYSTEYSQKGVKEINILNLDERDGEDDEGEKRTLVEEDYHTPRPLEGRHSVNAASLLPARRLADEALGEAANADARVSFRSQVMEIDPAATDEEDGQEDDEDNLASGVSEADSFALSDGGDVKERPLSSHHERQIGYNKTAVLNKFGERHPETFPDLRMSSREGKRHIFHGYHSYYFH
eukprot:m.272505 g.272505  ORF g.272505 m.272505 type:complete len:436 (+) comp40563_c0_seq11:5072-6379(+)